MDESSTRGAMRLAAAALFALIPPAMIAALFLHPAARGDLFFMATCVAGFAGSMMAGFLLGTRVGSQPDSQIALGCAASLALLLVNAGLFVLGLFLVR